jgi:VWFA-related protein
VLAIFGHWMTAVAQAPSPPLSTFFAPLDVPLVSVDVYVADRQGRPVPGLGIDDFHLLEDGRPVEISHFYAAPGVAQTPVTPENGEPAAAPVEEPSATPKQDIFLVVFFDDTNLSRSRRRSAVDHLERFFQSPMPAGFKVMIIAYDGRIQVLQPFTSDVAEAAKSLENANHRASLSLSVEQEGLINEMQRTRAMAEASPAQAESILQNSGSALYQQIQSYADQSEHRIRTSCANLQKVFRSLSGLEGRKALLLVSDGVEPRPGERLFRQWAETFGSESMWEIQAAQAFNEAVKYDVTDAFVDVSQSANGYRVTLYTLSSLSGINNRAISAEYRLMDEGRLSVIQAMSEDVLKTNLAATTGGRPLENSPALGDQLAEVAAELGSYYSLAYRPDHVGDGKYYRIKVDVDVDHAQVRYREGYYDTPQRDQIDSRTLAAAIHGFAENPMGIEVHTFAATPRDDGTFLVPFLVIVPIGELVLVPTADQHQGLISIHLAVCDDDGALSDLQRLEYPVPVANDQLTTALGKTAGFTVRLGMRSGKQRIAVGVLDEVGRAESVVTLEVDPEGAGG